MIAMIIV